VTVDLSIYLVTDAGQVARRGRDLVDVVAAAVAGGVTAVQVREKDAPARALLTTVTRVSDALPDGTALFVNDRVDVFLAARAQGVRVTGVHIGQDDLPLAVVRTLVGPSAVIGVSAAAPDQIAAAAGADYVGIGALHATRTKPDAPPALGLDGFTRLAALTPLPSVAIGGVTAADLPGLRAAGAAGAAVVSAVCDADDPRAAAAALSTAWRTT
jgi:thiamine-phosphate pyrophosphorylase